MAQFFNFFEDFGLRCFDLYGHEDPLVSTGERDVTKALCVLAAALTIPHERLRPANNSKGKPLDAGAHCHHPAGDTFHHSAAAQSYRELLAKDFATTLGIGGEWHQGTLSAAWGEPFPATTPDAVISGKTVGGVLAIIRNGLAHGSIQTFAANHDIERVRFLSLDEQPECLAEVRRGDTYKIKYVTATLSGLSELLREWKSFLKTLTAAV